jgi:Holliday junction resolvase
MSKNVKKFANKREKKLSTDWGIKRTPNSGSLTHFKGDLFSNEQVIDVKSTKSKQVIVTTDMLEKLVDDASQMGRDPVLVLDFPNSKLVHKQWVLMPKNFMEFK